ncbi:hypothetical protein BCR42DRAFT_410466 [Absidia repens]|uniref:Uncharacterized protein n=1 Tax=Absidia repens TaxID=90262 RepID=A0A1X2IP27_9FUNG|nr:hypothetical protein BCR42DRAFT_410466 [Absidia repens]
MKQATYSQQWYDRLCRTYDIINFPPLHSFSFTDWHLVNDSDFEKNRPLKLIPSASLSDDFWAVIMDLEEAPTQLLYSDVVRQRHSPPAKVILHPSTKWRNLKSAKNGGDFRAETMDDVEDDDDFDLWCQYKTMQRQKTRRGDRRPLKPRTSRLCRDPNDDTTVKKKKTHRQRKRHTRKLTHHRKSPIRLVRRQNRHCARF